MSLTKRKTYVKWTINRVGMVQGMKTVEVLAVCAKKQVTPLKTSHMPSACPVDGTNTVVVTCWISIDVNWHVYLVSYGAKLLIAVNVLLISALLLNIKNIQGKFRAVNL